MNSLITEKFRKLKFPQKRFYAERLFCLDYYERLKYIQYMLTIFKEIKNYYEN
jgi:hypothetical protein